MKVRIAVGMWKDQQTGEWKSYAEGWEQTENSGDPRKSAEETIVGNSLNRGQPLFWRFIEAEVPVPEFEEVTVEGTCLPEVVDPKGITYVHVTCFQCKRVYSAPAREEDGDADCPHCGAL